MQTGSLIEGPGHPCKQQVMGQFGRRVPTGLRWSFRRLCERAGLNWVPTPHHIKHSVVSWFAVGRVPIYAAADWFATHPSKLRRVYRSFDLTYLRIVGTALNL